MKHAPAKSHNVTTTRGGDAATVPEPSFAERARTLVHLGQVGTLSSSSQKQPGFPFGSVMPYALDDEGNPLFLISALAMHTQNLRGDPRASLLVTEESVAKDPLGAGRVTLLGHGRPVGEDDADRARELYLERHPNAAYWVDYRDFDFYRLEVIDVYFVGGFGVMGWIEAEGYAAARPDPLADAAAGILEHMNEDHGLVLLARHHTEHAATAATMTRVDRLGFHLRLQVEDGVRGCRIAFPREVGDADLARVVFREMVEAARAAC